MLAVFYPKSGVFHTAVPLLERQGVGTSTHQRAQIPELTLTVPDEIIKHH